jgi:uncharacterized protein (DUF433 family)
MQFHSVRVPLAADHDGILKVEGKSVTLEQILDCYESGAMAEEIVDSHPGLTLGEVYAVLGYYLQNRREIEAYRCRCSGGRNERTCCAA